MQDNEEIVIDDTLTVTEDTDTVEEDTTTEETPEVDVEKLKETNKKLFERAKKAELELKKFKPLQTEGKKPDDAFTKRIENLEMSEKKRQFGYEHGLSPQATDAIFRINPNPSKKDLEDPFIKAGVEAINRKQRVEDNTPSPSGNTVKYNGKDWNELTPEEKNANWSKRVAAYKK